MDNNFVLFTMDSFLSGDIYFVIILFLLAINKMFFRQIKAIIGLITLCLGITYLFNLCKDINTVVVIINSRVDQLLMILLPKISNLQPSKALPNYAGINILKVLKATYLRFITKIVTSPVILYINKVQDAIKNLKIISSDIGTSLKNNLIKNKNEHNLYLQFT